MRGKRTFQRRERQVACEALAAAMPEVSVPGMHCEPCAILVEGGSSEGEA